MKRVEGERERKGGVREEEGRKAGGRKQWKLQKGQRRLASEDKCNIG